ncbi:hypothetical protein BCR36DRAFT_408034 [Piromyces finnis]|uniref:MMS19 nucleotide excision repair protein n=1 Tax=Piromyces finnis TaxID=1754191 RepID=A0A1Y1VNS3_9FUNG|nr:hypothetical protein BCR36DRAFT_408034 [Piromyces finnis]|eukprot:ORX61054.1 hypothetical protein BCR36DRAFT_408034 [Piromyces finnis]
MISEIQTFIENKSNTKEAFDSLNQMIQYVNNKKVTILMIVEDLSDTLVNTDPKIRAKGVELLIKVFSNCDVSIITPKIASVILKFCLERLNDLHSLQSLLEGILYITENLEIDSEIVNDIPKTLFDELTIQGYQQTVRHVIFKIYDSLVEKYLSELKKIEDIFVPGFVQTVEGEKDPRNIMIIFKIIKIILKEMNYKPYIEDIFEIVFCYFPISFKSPPGNVIKITTEDLKNGLRECLTAVPEISKFAIPQLIEKLSSRLDNTKRDSIDILVAGGEKYDIEDYINNLEKLTEILRDEAFDNAGESLESLYLDAISSFTNIYSRGGNECLDKYIKEMTSKPISYIKDYGHPRGKFSRNIICAVIKENEYAFNKIINEIFPDLMDKIEQPNPPSVQSFLMEYVRSILSIANLRFIGKDNIIYQYKDILFKEFNELKKSDDDNDFKKDMEISSIGGLYEMANLEEFLPADQIKDIINDFNNKLLSDSREEIRKLCLKNILGLSMKNSDLITTITLPLLYNKLQADMIDSNYEWVLQSYEDITIECKFYEDTISKLISLYEDGINGKQNTDYLTKLLESVKNIIDRGIQKEINNKDIIVNCFPIFKDNILRIVIHNSVQQREELQNIDIISLIFQKFQSIMDEDKNKEFNEEILNIFVNKKLLNSMDIDGNIEFNPLNENSPKAQTCLLNILISITCNISQDIFNNTTAKVINEEFLNTLVKSIINTLNSNYANLVSKFISLYCIRFNDEKCIQNRIKAWIENDIYSVINSNMVFKETTIILFSWFLKVLFVKSNPDVSKYTLDLINLIPNESHATSCVNGMKTIFDVETFPIEANSLYTIDTEFEGNLINTLLNELIVIYKSSEIKNIHVIVALGVLLKLSNVKSITCKEEVKPIMLYALTLEDSSVLVSSLEFLIVLTSALPNELRSDLFILIKYLLRLTKAKNSLAYTIKVRVLSLRFLDLISKTYDNYELLPMKQNVINELDCVLDDNKKYVRKMAVHCRNQWFTLVN